MKNEKWKRRPSGYFKRLRRETFCVPQTTLVIYSHSR